MLKAKWWFRDSQGVYFIPVWYAGIREVLDTTLEEGSSRNITSYLSGVHFHKMVWQQKQNSEVTWHDGWLSIVIIP